MQAVNRYLNKNLSKKHGSCQGVKMNTLPQAGPALACFNAFISGNEVDGGGTGFHSKKIAA